MDKDGDQGLLHRADQSVVHPLCETGQEGREVRRESVGELLASGQERGGRIVHGLIPRPMSMVACTTSLCRRWNQAFLVPPSITLGPVGKLQCYRLLTISDSVRLSDQ